MAYNSPYDLWTSIAKGHVASVLASTKERTSSPIFLAEREEATIQVLRVSQVVKSSLFN